MIFLMGAGDMLHGYCGYASQVLNMLTGTEDMPHGTEDMPQGYGRYASWVLQICLTGTTDMPHGYS